MIKKRLAMIISMIIAVAGIINTANQWKRYFSAKRKNEQLVWQIKELEEKKRVLAAELEYVSTDEYKMRLAKEKLGMGTENDYWIVIEE